MHLSRPAPDHLQREIAHYRDIVAKTYTGLTNQQAYDLAYYDNLETTDPLGRCPYYRGTDQRDYFIPRLKELLEQLPDNAQIGDFGAGDGKTTAMALGALRNHAVINIVEPSPAIKAYEVSIHRSPNLTLGASLQMGMEYLGTSDGLAIADGSLDIALCIHSIYFFDIESGVLAMYKKLKPGGSLFIVFADETNSTTGRAITGYFSQIGRFDVAAEHMAIFEHRLALLASNAGESNIASIIQRNFDRTPGLTIEDAASRFYADKFGNMAAFGLLSGLPFFEPKGLPPIAEPNLFNIRKILSVLEALSDCPENFDLGIVNQPDDPRHGMWTTTQPQKIVILTKASG